MIEDISIEDKLDNNEYQPEQNKDVYTIMNDGKIINIKNSIKNIFNKKKVFDLYKFNIKIITATPVPNIVLLKIKPNITNVDNFNEGKESLHWDIYNNVNTVAKLFASLKNPLGRK